MYTKTCVPSLKVIYILSFSYDNEAHARNDESWGYKNELNFRIRRVYREDSLFAKAHCSIEFRLYIYFLTTDDRQI